ncbi:unnamed protein product [Chrysoparadoxa australica]
MKEDWYAILGVVNTATEDQIKKSYRKLALKCHPDKNPDNPEAAKQFDKLTRSRDFLLHAKTRKEYDEKKAAREARDALNAKRTEAMGIRRRRMMDKLNETEKGVVGQRAAEAKEAAKKLAELNKLKEEGRRRREAAADAAHAKRGQFQGMRESAKRKAGGGDQAPLEERQVKVKWKRKQHSHSDDTLANLFGKFGHVEGVVLYGTAGNSAIVTFETAEASGKAVDEFGDGEGLRASHVGSRKRSRQEIPKHQEVPQGEQGKRESNVSEADYESLVMMRMRQAAERRRLIREMEGEGDGEGQDGVGEEAAAAAEKVSTPPAEPAVADAAGVASSSAGEVGGSGAAPAAGLRAGGSEADILLAMLSRGKKAKAGAT